MSKRWERQGIHLLVYALLGALLYGVTQWLPGADARVWGLSVAQWIAASWVFAGLFQAWVTVFWRLELHGQAVSKALGPYGFLLHTLGYVVLGFGTFACILPICFGTRWTSPLPSEVSLWLVIVTTPLFLWGLWGAAVYFGLWRAAGIDHFDPAYRKGYEKRGIYKYIPNAMYTVVVVGFLYHPALFFESSLGLAVAVIHHAFVWTHYFCTEKPDLREMYGAPASPRTCPEEASTAAPCRERARA